jgi:hypothetical protein
MDVGVLRLGGVKVRGWGLDADGIWHTILAYYIGIWHTAYGIWHTYITPSFYANHTY